MNITIVDTPVAFDRAMDELEHFTACGLDTETVGDETYRLFKLAERIERDSDTPRQRCERVEAIYATQYRSRNPKVREYRDTLRKRVRAATSLAANTIRDARRSPSGLNFWENKLACVQLAGYGVGFTTIFLVRPHAIHAPDRLETYLNRVQTLLAHNLQFDWKQLRQHLGITLSCLNLFDTFVAEYMLTNGQYPPRRGLKAVVKKYAGVDLEKGEAVSNWLDEWSDAQRQYAADDVAYLPRVYHAQRLLLRQYGLVERFERECELVLPTAKMEMEGIGVDRGLIRSHWIPQYRALSQASKEALLKTLGAPKGFNPNSNVQLLHALQQAGLPIQDTNKKTLKKHEDSPVVQALLGYRRPTKVLTTYLEPFLTRSVEASPDHYRVYGTFSPYKVETGRFSSADPNLQNLPADESFRSIFIPRPGHVFISGDLSQIELRVLAEVSQDPNLLRAFEEEKDCHTFAASLVHGIPFDTLNELLRVPDEELKDDDLQRKKQYKHLRGATKTIQFGLIYGQTEHGLSRELGVSETKARALIRRYFLNYRRVKRAIERVQKQAHLDGFVRTLGGRIRYLDGLDSPHSWARRRAERQAFNTVIQGTAADGLKLSLIHLDNLSRGQPFYLVAVVHDEVLLEVPDDPLLITRAKEAVVKAFKWGNERFIQSVPVQVGSADRNWEPVVVRNWGEAK